jgi:CheY-like chemotaxis protein
MQRILVIDDEAEMRALLEKSLGSSGYEVVSAADGKEALKLQRKTPANLVITDIFMPVMEGFETIAALRKEFPQVPIIAISGKAVAPDFLAVAQRLGAVKALEKPFTFRDLLQAVKEVLPS